MRHAITSHSMTDRQRADTGDAPDSAVDLLARGRAERLGVRAKRGRRPFSPGEVDELRSLLSKENGTAAAAAAALRWLALRDAERDGRLDPAGHLARAPNELAAQLDRTDASVRLPVVAAAAAIGRRHPEAVVPVVDRLLAALDRPESRAGAAEELAVFASDSPEPLRDRLTALEPGLSAESAYARDMTAYAVKSVAGTHPTAARPLLEALVALLDDPESTVRGSAAWALAPLASVATDSIAARALRLSDLAAGTDESAWTREGACAALAALADADPDAAMTGVHALIDCLDERIASTAAADALRVLAAADPDALAPAGRFLATVVLDERRDVDERVSAAQALSELREVRPRSCAYAVRGLTRQAHDSERGRIDTLRVLAPLDAEEARTRLRSLMAADDASVRDGARRELRRLGRESGS